MQILKRRPLNVCIDQGGGGLIFCGTGSGAMPMKVPLNPSPVSLLMGQRGDAVNMTACIGCDSPCDPCDSRR